MGFPRHLPFIKPFAKVSPCVHVCCTLPNSGNRKGHGKPAEAAQAGKQADDRHYQGTEPERKEINSRFHISKTVKSTDRLSHAKNQRAVRVLCPGRRRGIQGGMDNLKRQFGREQLAVFRRKFRLEQCPISSTMISFLPSRYLARRAHTPSARRCCGN